MLKRYLSRADDDAVVKARRIEELGPNYHFTKYFDIFGGTVFRGLMKKGGDVKSVIDSIVENARKEYGNLVVDVLLLHFSQEDMSRDFEKSLISVLDPTGELSLFDLEIFEGRRKDTNPPFLQRLDLRNEYYRMVGMGDEEIEREDALVEQISKSSDSYLRMYTGEYGKFEEKLRSVQDNDYLVHTEALIQYWAISHGYAWEVNNFIMNCISSTLCARGEIPSDRDHIVLGTLIHIMYYNSRVNTTPSLASRFFEQERHRVLRNGRLHIGLKYDRMIQLRNYFVLDMAAAQKDWGFLQELYQFTAFLTNGQPGLVLSDLSDKRLFLKSLLIHGDLELYEMYFQTTAIRNRVKKIANDPERRWNRVEGGTNMFSRMKSAYVDVLRSKFVILRQFKFHRELVETAALYAPIAIWERFLQDMRLDLNSSVVLNVLIRLAFSTFGNAVADDIEDAEGRLRAALKVQQSPLSNSSDTGEVSEQRLSAHLKYLSTVRENFGEKYNVDVEYLDTKLAEIFAEEQLE